jgi:hypothetical protein
VGEAAQVLQVAARHALLHRCVLAFASALRLCACVLRLALVARDSLSLFLGQAKEWGEAWLVLGAGADAGAGGECGQLPVRLRALTRLCPCCCCCCRSSVLARSSFSSRSHPGPVYGALRYVECGSGEQSTKTERQTREGAGRESREDSKPGARHHLPDRVCSLCCCCCAPVSSLCR